MENKRKVDIEIKVTGEEMNNFKNNFKSENKDNMEVEITLATLGKTLIESQTLLQTLIYTNARLIAKNEGVDINKVLAEIQLVKEGYLKDNINKLNQ